MTFTNSSSCEKTGPGDPGLSRRLVVFVAVLGPVAGLAVGSLGMLRWGSRTGLLPISAFVPSSATPAGLEAAYKSQIDRLTQLAKDADLRGSQATNNPRDVKLFSPPEILEATLQENQFSFRLVTARSHRIQSRLSGFEAHPSVKRAVVNIFWDVMPDGSRVEVAQYQRRVIDSDRNDIGIILLFDLQRLRVLAEEREMKGPH